MHHLFLFLAALGLRCSSGAFSGLSERGSTVSLCLWASNRDDFSYCKAQALGQVGFSSGGSWALDLGFDSCGARA